MARGTYFYGRGVCNEVSFRMYLLLDMEINNGLLTDGLFELYGGK